MDLARPQFSFLCAAGFLMVRPCGVQAAVVSGSEIGQAWSPAIRMVCPGFASVSCRSVALGVHITFFVPSAGIPLQGKQWPRYLLPFVASSQARFRALLSRRQRHDPSAARGAAWGPPV